MQRSPSRARTARRLAFGTRRERGASAAATSFPAVTETPLAEASRGATPPSAATPVDEGCGLDGPRDFGGEVFPKRVRRVFSINRSRLRPTIAATFPLEEAAAALEQLEAGHVRGKIVLKIS